ncbi:MAG: putative nucleotidyltransferase with HDIG domain [Patescibacteria group bacterium]|jgi:putative nucleotidyltransferase with HDIG domain
METKKEIEDAYSFAKKTYANSDIYFRDHIIPVANISRRYATELKADPLITELGGLFHDIGYTENYNPKEEDHIQEGIKITSQYLKDTKIPKKTQLQIIDCIRTHDGNLKNNSPLENIIVHDIDLMSSIDQTLPMLRLMSKWGISLQEGISRLEEDAVKNMSQISNNPILQIRAQSIYKRFNDNITYLKEQYGIN